MADSELEQYRKFVKANLDKLTPVFNKASVGDFSPNLEIPEEENEFTSMLVGVQVMIEVIREKIEAYEKLNKELEQRVEARAQELAKKQRELSESEKKFREIIENSTNLFYVHDVNQVLTYVSPQSKRLLGVSPKEALTKWMSFATDNPINLRGREMTEKAIKTGRAQAPYELELKGKSGKIVRVQVNEAPIVEDGKTVAIIGSLTDITELRMQEQEIRQRTAELERFNRLMIGRELKMAELKQEIKRLKKELADQI